MWKTREGMNPPPNFWADFLANVNVVFPSAVLSRDELDKIYKLVVEQWRDGVQLQLIVRQLCSCDDGATVKASPAAVQQLGRHRGVARAPIGAERGEVFTAAQLRDTRAIGDIVARLHLIEAKLRAIGSGQRAGKASAESLQAEKSALESQLAQAREKAFWLAWPGSSEKERTAAQNAPLPSAEKVRRTPKPRAEKAPTAKAAPRSVVVGTGDGSRLDDDISDDLMRELTRRVVTK